jgi:hypothetical protein
MFNAINQNSDVKIVTFYFRTLYFKAGTII